MLKSFPTTAGFAVFTCLMLFSDVGQASSWLGWGQGKKESKPILGMATPVPETNGATPKIMAAPLELSEDDMAVMTVLMQDQSETLKDLRGAIGQREAEADARRKLAEANIMQKEQRLAALKAQVPTVASTPKARPMENTPEKPVVAKPKVSEVKIKPYVVPRAPVSEWQAIVDAQKRNAPPKGNITVKSPAPPTVPVAPAPNKTP